MSSSAPNKKFDRRRVKEYIVKSYEFRHEAFVSLLFNEGDAGENGLHKIFKDIYRRNQSFENCIEDLIASAENIDKFQKLILILQQSNPRFEYELTDSSISSPATKPTFDTKLSNGNQWEKRSQPRGYTSSYQPEAISHPQIDRLQQDIEQLTQDIGVLEEIDALLEGVRRRIDGLRLSKKEKQRMMQEEHTIAANKSHVFQRDQESRFSPRKQPNPFSSPSSWRENPYAKPT